MINQDRYSISDNTEEQLENWLRSNLYDLHTSIPCSVFKYDSESGTVDVRVSVQRDVKGSAVALSILTEVPVVYPSGMNFCMTWPIEVGDTGLMIFCENSIDRWMESDGNRVVNPLDTRIHDYSDGVFVPGLKTYSNSKGIDNQAAIRYHDTNIELGKDGAIQLSNNNGSVTIDDDGSIEINGPSGGSIEIDSSGKICVNTSEGNLFNTILDAIQLSDVTGAAAVPIAAARRMVC